MNRALLFESMSEKNNNKLKICDYSPQLGTSLVDKDLASPDLLDLSSTDIHDNFHDLASPDPETRKQ